MLDVTALSCASTAFSVLEFVNILGMLTQILFVLGLKVKAYGSARIHKVIVVKIVFKRADYAVFLFAEVALKPRGKHLSDTVVVADGCTALLYGVENCCMISTELLFVLHFSHKDEVEVGALRIAMRHMSCNDCIRKLMANLTNLTVNTSHI